MRLFEKSYDGGENSGVTGYYLLEIKSLFSIVLLHFTEGSREAYHSHAFDAITIWLKGKVKEEMLSGESLGWKAGWAKLTPRENFHKIIAGKDGAWCISFRGPWLNKWHEFRNDHYVTLTHGRKEIAKQTVFSS